MARGRRSWKRWLVRAVVYPPLFLAVIAALFLAGGPRYYSAKYARVEGIEVSHRGRSSITAERQVEPHTCGLHSVRAIYTAYGIDPDAADLRFRLGTDTKALNLDKGSVGTIHPDILRVLGQDGFETDLIMSRSDGGAARMREHLEQGDPVLAMVRAGSAGDGGLHWVVIDRVEGGEVVVADSLVEAMRIEPADVFLRDRVLSAILVSAR